VATGETLGENETSLQQVLSGNNMKRSVLCAFVTCFIVNCEMN